MDEYLMANYYIPHLKKHLPEHMSALLVFDNFRAHSTDNVVDSFTKNKLKFLHLPPNCTPIIQPLDVGVNAGFKKRIRDKFTDWPVDQFDDVVYQKGTKSEKFHKAASVDQLLGWIIKSWDETTNETIQKSKLYSINLHHFRF